MVARLRPGVGLGLGLALIIASIAAVPARGDGLPVPFDGGDNVGVASLDGSVSYATVAAGAGTVAVKTATETGEILRTAPLRGDWGVPLVAYDGTPSGLSGDGERLVLIEPRTRFPRRQTTFALIDTDNMRVREQFTLDGDFSFDALSPDGQTMFLIHYPDPRDPTAYEVRSYDLEHGRLLAEPIIDPNESGEEMAGFPQTRAVSADGRWAYTLYEPAERDHPPFIHALDTEGGAAVCIDLDPLAEAGGLGGGQLGLPPGQRLTNLDLSPAADGASLNVLEQGEVLASVDLETFQVSEPVPPLTPVASSKGSDLGIWFAVGAGGALLGAGLFLARRRRVKSLEADQLDHLERLAATAATPGAAERERDPAR